jgi:hypothetical protein
LWLGNPLHGSQPTFTPESRHRFHFHRQPYCLDVYTAMIEHGLHVGVFSEENN